MMRKTLLVVISIIILAGFTGTAKAGSGDNVWGWAYSENIGWISFNSTNTGAAVNYGVNIDSSTGIFSGYAWSENIGWLSFNEADLTGCPSGACQAKLDFATNNVSGWVKILSSGNWLKLRGANYGVSLNQTTKEFTGFAWSDTDIGWLSFNCSDQGVCGTSNYKVMTSVSLPPSTSNLRTETWDACALKGTAALYPTLAWNYSGGTQDAYQIQIATSSDFITTKICDYTAISSSYQTRPTTCPLNYNTGYNWRLKVWNTEEVESAWNSSTFTTLKHAYPFIDFSWTPAKPAVGEIVNASDTSSVYGGATKSSWLWEFQNGNPASSTAQNATTTFLSTGSKTIKLKVTDSDTFFCTGQKTLNVQSRLPEWKEIKPF